MTDNKSLSYLMDIDKVNKEKFSQVISDIENLKAEVSNIKSKVDSSLPVDISSVNTSISDVSTNVNKYSINLRPVMMENELTLKVIDMSSSPVENCFEISGKGTIYGLFFNVSNGRPVTVKIDDATIVFEHYSPNGRPSDTRSKYCLVSLDKASIDSNRFGVKYFTKRDTDTHYCNVYVTTYFDTSIDKTRVISFNNLKSLGTIKSDFYSDSSCANFAVDPCLSFDRYFSISHKGTDLSYTLSEGIGALYKLEG